MSIHVYACLAAILEEVDQGVIRQQVKLLDNIARGIGRPARRPSEPLHRGNRNSMRYNFAGGGKGADEAGETCARFVAKGAGARAENAVQSEKRKTNGIKLAHALEKHCTKLPA